MNINSVENFKTELDEFRNIGKKLRGHLGECSDEITEFDLYIDLLLIVLYMFKTMIFFKYWYEKILKREDAERRHNK